MPERAHDAPSPARRRGVGSRGRCCSRVGGAILPLMPRQNGRRAATGGGRRPAVRAARRSRSAPARPGEGGPDAGRGIAAPPLRSMRPRAARQVGYGARRTGVISALIRRGTAPGEGARRCGPRGRRERGRSVPLLPFRRRRSGVSVHREGQERRRGGAWGVAGGLGRPRASRWTTSTAGGANRAPCPACRGDGGRPGRPRRDERSSGRLGEQVGRQRSSGTSAGDGTRSVRSEHRACGPLAEHCRRPGGQNGAAGGSAGEPRAAAPAGEAARRCAARAGEQQAPLSSGAKAYQCTDRGAATDGV